MLRLHSLSALYYISLSLIYELPVRYSFIFLLLRWRRPSVTDVLSIIPSLILPILLSIGILFARVYTNI